MNNGILHTALIGLPLELEYRPHNVGDGMSIDSSDLTISAGPARLEATPSFGSEFACLLKAL